MTSSSWSDKICCKNYNWYLESPKYYDDEDWEYIFAANFLVPLVVKFVPKDSNRMIFNQYKYNLIWKGCKLKIKMSPSSGRKGSHWILYIVAVVSYDYWGGNNFPID